MRLFIIIGLAFYAVISGATTPTPPQSAVDFPQESEMSDDLRRQLIQQAADENQWDKAFELVLPLAQKGDHQAQANLGILYVTGRGVAKDLDLAYWWFSEAAEKGSIKALNNLAVMYFRGMGVKKDVDHSIKLFKQTARSGSIDANLALAEIYDKTKNDAKQAFQWYQQAANLGSDEGKYQIATRYEMGYGVKKDVRKAKQLYQELTQSQTEFTDRAKARLKVAGE